MFGKRQAKEFEDLLADVRGLKRLAGLEERDRGEADQRLAGAIDALEGRVNALASASMANMRELSARIDRLAALVPVAAEPAQ